MLQSQRNHALSGSANASCASGLSAELSPTAPAWRRRIKSGHRIISTALVLAVGAVIPALLSAVGYCIGKNTESDLRFFEPRRPPTLDEACVACPIEYALRSNEENDVIFVGDSTCRVGIDPTRFEQATGLRAYNLGSEGGIGPTGFLITAKAYLSRHPRPRIVVLSMSPIGFEGGANEIAERLRSSMLDRFEANYGPEVPGLIPWSESAGYFAKRGSLAAWMAFSGFVAGKRDDGGARDIRDIPLSERPFSFRGYQQFVHKRRGYVPLPGLHGERRVIEYPGQRVKIDSEWDRNVRRLAQDCERMGVPLLMRFSPMPRDLSDVRDFRPLEMWSKTLRNSHRNVIVGSPTLLWYDPELCWDQIHLNDPGIAAYGAVLAKDVREALADESKRR
jgi:hypothetical protein